MFSKEFMQIKSVAIKTGHLLRETFLEFFMHNGFQLSAALSCYILFSLTPLLVIIISLSGLFFGELAVRGEVFDQINGLVGTRAATEIQQVLKTVKLAPETPVATTLGIMISIIAASGVFAEMQRSINFIWGVKATGRRGILKFLMHRLLSFLLLGSTGILLLVGLIINSLMDMLDSQLILYLPGIDIDFFYAVNLLILFLLVILLFVAVFIILPDGKITLRDCLTGALFTAVLFMSGKFLIGLYFDYLAGSSIYGAAGTLLVILTWIYYSAIIFYLGVEFTGLYARTYGKGISQGNSPA